MEERYTQSRPWKVRIPVLLCACLLLAVAVPKATTDAKEPCAVPKSWGKLVGVVWSNPLNISMDVLVFEDDSGTLRKTVADCKGTAKPMWEIARN